MHMVCTFSNGGDLEMDIFTKTEEIKTRWMEAIKVAK